MERMERGQVIIISLTIVVRLEYAALLSLDNITSMGESDPPLSMILLREICLLLIDFDVDVDVDVDVDDVAVSQIMLFTTRV